MYTADIKVENEYLAIKTTLRNHKRTRSTCLHIIHLSSKTVIILNCCYLVKLLSLLIQISKTNFFQQNQHASKRLLYVRCGLDPNLGIDTLCFVQGASCLMECLMAIPDIKFET